MGNMADRTDVVGWISHGGGSDVVPVLVPMGQDDGGPPAVGPLTFAEELMYGCWEDFIALARMHWEETEAYRHNQPFNPDKVRYINYNNSGFYRFYTARDNGKMVGYAGCYVTISMHTQVKICQEDTWFLHPAYRRGRNAIRLYRFIEDQMREEGVKESICSVKLSNGAGRILEYLKYKHVSNVYSKELTNVRA